MKSGNPALAVSRFVEIELAFCLFCNRFKSPPILWLFRTVSRLGDGPFWYLMIVSLFVFEPASGPLLAAGHVVGVGGVCLVTYKSIKRFTARARPYVREASIERLSAPLDQYSFPSGHTLHAVAFTSVLIQYQPQCAWALVPFTVLVALSRVILGLHYPTDVAAGAGLGATIAHLSFAF